MIIILSRETSESITRHTLALQTFVMERKMGLHHMDISQKRMLINL